MASDPIVISEQSALPDQAAFLGEVNPVTGLPFTTGAARMFVDLAQAVQLLDKET